MRANGQHSTLIGALEDMLIILPLLFSVHTALYQRKVDVKNVEEGTVRNIMKDLQALQYVLSTSISPGLREL